MSSWPDADFYTQSISFYLNRFRALTVPEPSLLEGRFKAQFIGPSWLVWLAPRLLPIGGLAGWYGKSFAAPDTAINVLRSGDQLVESVPMNRTVCCSRFDDQNAFVLTYGKAAPLLLRGLRDEFRALDADTLLGLTIVDVPVLKLLPLPFLLLRNR